MAQPKNIRYDNTTQKLKVNTKSNDSSLTLGPAKRSANRQIKTRYITPTGSGDGTSWINAGAFSQLSNYLSAVGPKGRVIVRMNDGDAYSRSSTLSLNFGGIDGKPITIDFCQSNGLPPHANSSITGTRTSFDSAYTAYLSNSETTWDTTAGGFNHGIDLFNVNSGATNLIFNNLKAKDFQHIISFGGHNRNIVINDPDCFNVRKLIHQFSSHGITNLSVYRPKVIGFSAPCILFAGTSSNWGVYGPGLMDSARQDKDTQIARGISMDGTATGLNVDGDPQNYGMWLEIKNCSHTAAAYWNGDGVSTEKPNSNVSIRRLKTHGHHDGGIDLKSSDNRISEVWSYDNKVNYRLWNTTMTLLKLKTSAPVLRGGNSDAAYFGVYNDTLSIANVTIKSSVVEDDNEAYLVLLNDGPGNLVYFVDTIVPASFSNNIKHEGGTGTGTVTFL